VGNFVDKPPLTSARARTDAGFRALLKANANFYLFKINNLKMAKKVNRAPPQNFPLL
jgi:hypothetical protein